MKVNFCQTLIGIVLLPISLLKCQASRLTDRNVDSRWKRLDTSQECSQSLLKINLRSIKIHSGEFKHNVKQICLKFVWFYDGKSLPRKTSTWTLECLLIYNIHFSSTNLQKFLPFTFLKIFSVFMSSKKILSLWRLRFIAWDHYDSTMTGSDNKRAGQKKVSKRERKKCHKKSLNK